MRARLVGWMALVVCSALLPAATVPLTALAAEKEVVFLGFGGTHERNMRRYVIPDFEKKTGIKVVYVTGTVASNYAKVQAQRSRPEGDVFWNNDLTHLGGRIQGLFEKLDPARVPNLKDVYDFAKDPTGVGVMQGFQAEGLQYNVKVFRERGLAPPTSWFDLWRPEVKGRVALYAGTNAYTQYFIPLLARITGGSERNVDPAFARMKTLVPSVITFLTAPAELDNLFKQNEAWLGYNGSSRTYELAAAGFPVDFVYPKEGAILFGNWFDVIKGAPHPEAAQEFVNYLIGEAAQAAIAKHIFFGPVNTRTRLEPDVARYVPYGPELAKGLIQLDIAAMNEHVGQWVERWNKEIERK